MKEKENAIREALKKHGMYVYQLGFILGKSEATITRMLRNPLPVNEQERIISAIEKYAEETAHD